MSPLRELIVRKYRSAIIFAFITAATLAVTTVTLAAPGGAPIRAATPTTGPTKTETCSTVTNKAKLSTKNGKVTGTIVRKVCKNGCLTGTLKIKVGGKVACELKTLELPWNDNKPNKSCIPVDQKYVCKRVNSPRFGVTFEIIDVDGRTHILFHAGNDEDDTSGCVLLGMAIDQYNHIAGGTSRAGLKKFLETLKGTDEFELTITDESGTCASGT